MNIPTVELVVVGFSVNVGLNPFRLDFEWSVVGSTLNTIEHVVINIANHVGVEIFLAVDAGCVASADAHSTPVGGSILSLGSAVRSLTTQIETPAAVLSVGHPTNLTGERVALVASIVLVVVLNVGKFLLTSNSLEEHTTSSTEMVTKIRYLQTDVTRWNESLTNHWTFHEGQVARRGGLLH